MLRAATGGMEGGMVGSSTLVFFSAAFWQLLLVRWNGSAVAEATLEKYVVGAVVRALRQVSED